LSNTVKKNRIFYLDKDGFRVKKELEKQAPVLTKILRYQKTKYFPQIFNDFL